MSNLIYIDSKDRSIGNSSIFNIVVDDLITNSKKEISVESVIIPKSFYAINTNNQTFLLNATTVTLAVGNYTAAQFKTEIEAKMTATAIDTYTWALDTITGKSTITAANLAFTITSNERNLRYLGLPASTVASSTLLGLKSTNVVDLASSRYIDIVLDGIGMASTNTYNKNKNVLARVYANVANFDTIYFTSSTFSYISIYTDKLERLQLSVVDDFGDLLDLNGSDISITLATRISMD